MSARGPWYQSNLGAAALGALVAAILIFAISVLFGDIWNSLPGWGKRLATGGSLFAGLLIWCALAGVRVNRRSYRDSLIQEGRDAAINEVAAARDALIQEGVDDALSDVEARRSDLLAEGRAQALSDVEKIRESLLERGRDQIRDEIKRERAAAKIPRFYIERAPFLSLDGNDAFYLYNGGAAVTNVSPEADEKYIEMGKPVGLLPTFKGEPLGQGIGMQFEGRVTQCGYEEGIIFRVHYLDQNQDPKTARVPVSQDRLNPVDRHGRSLR